MIMIIILRTHYEEDKKLHLYWYTHPKCYFNKAIV